MKRRGAPLNKLQFKRWSHPFNTITNRIAIQARIAEWQRQYRSTEYKPTDFFFGVAKARADWIRWFHPDYSLLLRKKF